MTNETAIHRLLLVRHRKDCTELLAEALDMAIEALSCSEEPNKSDTIYRQDAIDVVKGIDSYFVKYIEELPSAQPEQRWIPTRIAKPPKAGQYLVTKQQKTGVRQIATAYYNPSFDEWSGNGNFTKVLAWQQLPTPYTQE